MDARDWLERVRSECVRQNLPPLYVERLARELTDHQFDVMEDSMSTDAKGFGYLSDRLGMPGEIATSAAREYRQQRFSGRHPVLMFVVLPILTLPLLWSATITCLLLVAQSLGFNSEAFSASPRLSSQLSALMPFLEMGILLVPIALATVVFCRLATRAAVSWKWTLTTCAILAFIAGAAFTQVNLPTAASKGTVLFGFGASLFPKAQQWLQFTLPLAIGGWVVYRQMNRSRGALAA